MKSQEVETRSLGELFYLPKQDPTSCFLTRIIYRSFKKRNASKAQLLDPKYVTIP